MIRSLYRFICYVWFTFMTFFFFKSPFAYIFPYKNKKTKSLSSYEDTMPSSQMGIQAFRFDSVISSLSGFSWSRLFCRYDKHPALQTQTHIFLNIFLEKEQKYLCDAYGIYTRLVPNPSHRGCSCFEEKAGSPLRATSLSCHASWSP